MSAVSANSQINSPFQNLGTGPTPAMKENVSKVMDSAKEVFNKTVDTVGKGLKTPEGKAIAAGIIIAPFNPVIGLGMVFGGAASAALSFLKKTADPTEELRPRSATSHALHLAKDAAMIVGGVALTPINPVAGVAVIAMGATEANKDLSRITKK